MYSRYIKRILDIVFSLVLIIVLLPIYLIVSILVLIFMGSPVLFAQERLGKDEKTFMLYKFRSMTNKTNNEGKLLPEEARLTKFGSFLRSSSIDELPELLAILCGDMSFIGPRPLPVYYQPFFLEHERTRHSVRGGLIPPDSLSGKAYTTWEEQFEYEVEYAKNITFKTDIKVFFATIKILFQRFHTSYGTEFGRPHLDVYRGE